MPNSLVWVLCAGLVWVAGCRRGESAPVLETTASGGGRAPEAMASERARLHSVRALADEAHRAELDVGGRFVDFGTADQHKYIQGGWANGWGTREHLPDGTSFTTAAARAVSLRLFIEDGELPAQVAAVRMRARARPRSVSLLLDRRPLGTVEVGTDWTVVHIPIAPGRLAAGWRELGLVFESRDSGIRADIDWVWLGRDPGSAAAGHRTTSGPSGAAGGNPADAAGGDAARLCLPPGDPARSAAGVRPGR